MSAFIRSRFMTHLRELPAFLAVYLRDPVRGMKISPAFSWPALLSLQVGVAIISGALLALVRGSFIEFVLGIVIFPLVIALISLGFTAFIFYYFAFIRATHLEFRRLYGIVVLSTLPYFVLHIASFWLPPIDLIGFAITGALLTVGLVEHFSITKKRAMGLIGLLLALFVVVWISTQISMNDSSHELGVKTHPESLDQLERGLRD